MTLSTLIHNPHALWLALVGALFSPSVQSMARALILKGRNPMDLNAVIKDVELVVSEIQPVIDAVQEFASADTDDAKAAKLQPILKAFIDRLPVDSAAKSVAETPAILELVCKLAVTGVSAAEHLAQHPPVVSEVAPPVAPEAPAVPQ